MSIQQFQVWWKRSGRPGVYNGVDKCYGLLAGMSDTERDLFVRLALNRTKVVTCQQNREKDLREEQLFWWAVKRGQQEFRRLLPLHPRLHEWLWTLSEEHRRVMLLDYAYPGPNSIAIAWNLGPKEAETKLREARTALVELIRKTDLREEGWVEPKSWML